MSDSEDSMVTYNAVSSPFANFPDIGSPGVDGPPVMPEDPYAYVVAAFRAPPYPNYVPGLEYPPSPDFVLELVYPEFMPPKDESDPEEDPEEDDDEDPEEDPADYPADGGDGGDDEDESSEDDDVDIAEDEHPAPADSTAVALPAVDHAPSAEETEPFETDESAATPPPHPAYLVTARISIRDEPPTPFWSDTKVARLLAIHTPPPSPLSLWSSPLPQIPSPPLPSILSPLPVSSPPPASPICPLGYRAAMIRLRAEAPSTSYSLPLPTPIIISNTRSVHHHRGHHHFYPYRYLLHHHLCIYSLLIERARLPLLARPPGGFRADYGFVATMDREIMQDLERDVSYGITDTWEEMLVDMPGATATDDIELGRRMTEFTTRVRQDTDEIYTRDRCAHARAALLIEREAMMSREAWGRSMDTSDLARSE
ncbi:hypothetical protein Tco_1124345, partial [Tanacetum coccineum]